MAAVVQLIRAQRQGGGSCALCKTAWGKTIDHRPCVKLDDRRDGAGFRKAVLALLPASSAALVGFPRVAGGDVPGGRALMVRRG